MDLADALRLLFLLLVLAALVAARRWPGISHRKFDWRLFRKNGRKR